MLVCVCAPFVLVFVLLIIVRINVFTHKHMCCIYHIGPRQFEVLVDVSHLKIQPLQCHHNNGSECSLEQHTHINNSFKILHCKSGVTVQVWDGIYVL